MEDTKFKLGDLLWLKEAGINYYLSKDNHRANSLNSTAPKKSEKILSPQKSPDKPSNEKQMDIIAKARSIADKASNLAELKQSLLEFEDCKLKQFATNTVFADGVENSKIMFIGEAPGASEDLRGIPFCGESGELLDKMLASIGIYRNKNAYITNTVFWRPPANRAPTPEEINICRPFVEKHIALISPRLIVLVGNTAATSLLGQHEGITKIRKKHYSYTNKYLSAPIPTTAIFHPAYLLRQPLQKKSSWFDLIKIQQFAGEYLA